MDDNDRHSRLSLTWCFHCLGMYHTWPLWVFRSLKLWKNILLATYAMIMFFALFNSCSRCQTVIIDMNKEQMFPGLEIPKGTPCRPNLNALGLVSIDMSTPNITKMEESNNKVYPGGHWSPHDCSPWQHVAIIVPYRDRWNHLLLLLRRLHPMLQKQKVSYRIFVIEQAGSEAFNRGKLKNIGAVEARKHGAFDCVIFHDVDLLPENYKNIYFCDKHVLQLSSAIDEMRYHSMYNNAAGGVVALNYENIIRVNGYSNVYWGWGNEDDDLSARTMEEGLLISRPPNHIGRFKMLRHQKDNRAVSGYDLLLTWRSRWKHDGINALNPSTFTVLTTEKHRLYTKIVVDVGQAPLSAPDLSGVPRESILWLFTFYFP